MPDLSLFTEKLRRFDTNALLLLNDTHTLRKIEHSPTTWLGRARHFCVAQFPYDLRLLFGSKRLEDWVYQVTLLYCAANGYFVPQLLLAYSAFFPKKTICALCPRVYDLCDGLYGIPALEWSRSVSL
jgi:hypothetical protein